MLSSVSSLKDRLSDRFLSHQPRCTQADPVSPSPELEAIAATTAPVIRHTSSAEKEWLTTLVQKHGDDFASAAMDRRLNVWQKTPGELKRMVRKAGGVAKLTGA